MINTEIFRAYDIRGSSLKDINEITAYKIGYCFTKLYATDLNSNICVGMDGRLSSTSIYNGLINGIIKAGGKVISLGLVPTPLLYFADKTLTPAASIMITGSHNPKDDNGFKMVANGKSFFGKSLEQLAYLINNTKWDDINIQNLNNSSLLTKIDITPKYIQTVINGLSLNNSNLKICWDMANGATCNVIKSIIHYLKNDNILINSDIDGNFPNHAPDPTNAKNLQQLIDMVIKNKCDIGLAFDGDGDRLGVVTSDGSIIWGDRLLAIFAKDILKHNPQALIIGDIKSSNVLFDTIKSHNGIPLMWKTGHALIKTKMHETKALLAGEMSGHFFFADKYFGYDDGIYTALRLIELIQNSDISFQDMLNEIPSTYNTPEIRVSLPKNTKFDLIDIIKNKLVNDNIQFSDIDGVRVDDIQGWWLIRASNTEDAISMRCEASTQQQLNILQKNLENLVQYAKNVLMI